MLGDRSVRDASLRLAWGRCTAVRTIRGQGYKYKHHLKLETRKEK